MTIICGHALTRAELVALDAVLDYLREHGGDSHWAQSKYVSPRGDGRAVPIREVFSGRSNAVNASLRAVYRLDRLGVLRACEVELRDGCLKGVPSLPEMLRVLKMAEEDIRLHGFGSVAKEVATAIAKAEGRS